MATIERQGSGSGCTLTVTDASVKWMDFYIGYQPEYTKPRRCAHHGRTTRYVHRPLLRVVSVFTAML